MADFCVQCARELGFGPPYDLAGFTTKEGWEKGLACVVLCEGCGAVQVDPDGYCISDDCLRKHGLHYRKAHEVPKGLRPVPPPARPSYSCVAEEVQQLKQWLRIATDALSEIHDGYLRGECEMEARASNALSDLKDLGWVDDQASH